MSALHLLTLDCPFAKCAMAGSTRPAADIFIIILENSFTAVWASYGAAQWFLLILHPIVNQLAHLHLPFVHISLFEEPTGREMIVASDCLATAEAKELATTGAHHFVAACTFTDRHSTMRT